jgi:hypothetical protein
MANWTIIGGSQGPVINPPSGGGSSGTTLDGLAEKATFFAGFGTPILPGQDYGVRHIVARASTPTTLYAYLSTPPPAGSFIFDVLLSQDAGVTWNTILGTPISIVSAAVVESTDFAAGTAFAPGNLLRLDVLSAGFSSGFQCVLTMQGAITPGRDRATFIFGISGNPPVGKDFGGYFIVSRFTAPGTVFVNVKSPPGDDVTLDLQVLREGTWTSILAGPLTVAAGFDGVLSSQEFARRMAFAPGDLIRPYLLSGPAACGMGYNVVLEMEVIQ